MLIDFTVENFRSIHEPVTLSAIAAPQKAVAHSRNGVLPDDQIAPPLSVPGRDFGLLPVLGIFGANASGKSNVLRALQTLLQHTAVWYAPLPLYNPFLLTSEPNSAPTRYELRVLAENTIYTYAIAATAERIVHERLEYQPPGSRTRLLYNRQWNATSQTYTWKNGPDFAGPHKQLQPNLNRQTSYLTALQSIAVRVLKPFTKSTIISGFASSTDHLLEKTFLVMDEPSDDDFPAEVLKKRVLSLLQAFDLTLSEFYRKPGNDGEGARVIDLIQRHGKHDPRLGMLVARRRIGDRLVEWNFDEESRGTQQLYLLAWQVAMCLHVGATLLVDELDASLHPKITRTLVRTFQSVETNPNRAQLIFTTHDVSLLDRRLLRRDQIWFTEKRADHSTDLYPLSDFRVRNDADLQRAYLDGRFGATPLVFEEDTLIQAALRAEQHDTADTARQNEATDSEAAPVGATA